MSWLALKIGEQFNVQLTDSRINRRGAAIYKMNPPSRCPEHSPSPAGEQLLSTRRESARESLGRPPMRGQQGNRRGRHRQRPGRRAGPLCRSPYAPFGGWATGPQRLPGGRLAQRCRRRSRLPRRAGRSWVARRCSSRHECRTGTIAPDVCPDDLLGLMRDYARAVRERADDGPPPAWIESVRTSSVRSTSSSSL